MEVFWLLFFLFFLNSLMRFLHKKKNKVLIDGRNGKVDNDTKCELLNSCKHD